MIDGEQNRRRQIRVVVADDTPDVVEAVACQLASDCIIVGRASDGIALVECICELRPDLLVTDISMPNLSGFQALQKLRELGIQTPTIVLTISADEEVVNEALSLGARGFVLKSRLYPDLRLAVHSVFVGRTFVSNFSQQSRAAP